MEKDFTKVRYLKFSAEDTFECVFYDVIIDLVDDRLVSGIIKFGEEGQYDTTINIEKNLEDLVNHEYSIFAKVVDSGMYWLLDENFNALFKSEGYVPKLMDYYNGEEGFGDYIDLYIDDIKTGKLRHHDGVKIAYNRVDDWEEIEQIEKTPNLYVKGMNDAFDAIMRIIQDPNGRDFALQNIITFINSRRNDTNN